MDGYSGSSLPEVTVISNVVIDGKPIGALGAGEAEWHTDMSYQDVPPSASVLYALEICLPAAIRASAICTRPTKASLRICCRRFATGLRSTI